MQLTKNHIIDKKLGSPPDVVFFNHKKKHISNFHFYSLPRVPYCRINQWHEQSTQISLKEKYIGKVSHSGIWFLMCRCEFNLNCPLFLTYFIGSVLFEYHVIVFKFNRWGGAAHTTHSLEAVAIVGWWVSIGSMQCRWKAIHLRCLQSYVDVYHIHLREARLFQYR